MSAAAVMRELDNAIDKVFACEGAPDVAEVARLADRMECLKLGAFRAYERSERWREEGFVTAAAAVRKQCHLTEGAARHALDLARKLEALPVLAGAFAAGEVSRAHAEVLAKAFTPERAAAMTALESQLVDIAKETNARGLGEAVQRVTDALDGDGGAAGDHAKYERRRLHASKTIDQLVALDGLLDPMSGEVVLTALKAEMRRDHQKCDPRTTAQRRADALVNIFRRALDNAEVGTTRKSRPNVTVVVDAEKIENGWEMIAEAANTGGISQATLERVLCDCTITRVVTNGPSQVLDVGRATRTISHAQWSAVVARDRVCTGCGRPPGDCQVHHKYWWTAGGETNLADLELKCDYCHRAIHERNEIRRT
jgi:hypothetical protein